MTVNNRLCAPVRVCIRNSFHLPRSTSLYLVIVLDRVCHQPGQSAFLYKMLGSRCMRLLSLKRQETRPAPRSAHLPIIFSATGRLVHPILRSDVTARAGKLALETGPIPHYYAAVTYVIVYTCVYNIDPFPRLILFVKG